MKCYFQGCNENANTKEHIPPRAFFPDGEKTQLLTVKSCENHNNEKSKDDLYALAQICINASPNNRAREIFENKIAPQLKYNNGSLAKKLSKGAKILTNGSVAYQVDQVRMNNFFTALSCGIIYKTCKASLPVDYEISHIFHNFDPKNSELEDIIGEFYSGQPMSVLEFGKPDVRNERIYTVKIFGIPEFRSSITIVHSFYGVFKVTSMLSKY